MIAEDRHYWEQFAPIVEHMVEDASVAVRTCVADTLTQALRYDRPAAIRFFLRLCDTDDILLADDSIERFLYYATAKDFDAVRPVLERMTATNRPSATWAFDGNVSTCSIRCWRLAATAPIRSSKASGGDAPLVEARQHPAPVRQGQQVADPPVDALEHPQRGSCGQRNLRGEAEAVTGDRDRPEGIRNRAFDDVDDNDPSSGFYGPKFASAGFRGS